MYSYLTGTGILFYLNMPLEIPLDQKYYVYLRYKSTGVLLVWESWWGTFWKSCLLPRGTTTHEPGESQSRWEERSVCGIKPAWSLLLESGSSQKWVTVPVKPVSAPGPAYHPLLRASHHGRSERPRFIIHGGCTYVIPRKMLHIF